MFHHSAKYTNSCKGMLSRFSGLRGAAFSIHKGSPASPVGPGSVNQGGSPAFVPGSDGGECSYGYAHRGMFPSDASLSLRHASSDADNGKSSGTDPGAVGRSRHNWGIQGRAMERRDSDSRGAPPAATGNNLSLTGVIEEAARCVLSAPAASTALCSPGASDAVSPGSGPSLRAPVRAALSRGAVDGFSVPSPRLQPEVSPSRPGPSAQAPAVLPEAAATSESSGDSWIGTVEHSSGQLGKGEAVEGEVEGDETPEDVIVPDAGSSVESPGLVQAYVVKLVQDLRHRLLRGKKKPPCYESGRSIWIKPPSLTLLFT